jgi:LacI family transcriptional regulator
MATNHLIEQGCRRIAHIRGPEVSTAIGRAEGYRHAIAQHGIPSLPGYVVPVGAFGDERGEVGGYSAAKTLLEMNPRPDGIFCYNDPVAVGVMQAILNAGLRIPEDVAVVGCGNVHYSDFLRVPLTTVDQNSDSLGRRAAELALSLIDSKTPVRPSTILVEPTLVLRASSLRKR